ncbi:MAG: tetratricopeptide repeat protein [Saprospiraceae bacterium]|nr:tetratricopeptide repeat protein [Saprospiraceae bacterium]
MDINKTDFGYRQRWALMEAGKLYTERNADSSLLYLQQALDLAERIKFEKGIVRCRINKANAIYNLGKYDEAIALDLSTIPLCDKLGLAKEKVAAYNLMGNAWNQRGNFWLAIEYYDKALEAMKTTPVPPHFPVVVSNNIAIIYNGLKLYEKGKEYAERSFEKAKEIGDEASCAVSCQHIGNSHLGMNRNDEAYKWFELGLEYGRKSDYPAVIANSLGILADLEMKKGNLQKATKFYEEGLQTAINANEAYGKMTNLHGIGLLAFEKKDFKKSKNYCLQSLAISEEMGMDDYRASILLSLSDLALVDGDFSKWNAYRQEYQDIRDTITSNALVHAVQELEIKYETQAKEQKIKDLEQEKELQSLRLQRQRVLIFGTGLLALLLLAGGIFAWRFQKNKALLASQQNTIQAQTIKQLEQEKQLVTASAVMRGQEEERGRLARDLHDGLGGMLSGIKQNLFAMKGNQVLTETSATSLNQVIDDMDRSIGELRHIARNMMPEALVRFGLRDALEDYCDHTAHSTGLKVHFQSFGMEQRLTQDVEVIVFRIAQELLNNVVKHAVATQAIVQLIRDEDRVNLTVEDNGNGMDTDQLELAKGVGWMNIRSRVGYLDGRLDVHSSPGKGMSVGVEFEVKNSGS